MAGVAWWEPDTFGLAMATALLSTACWGSWSNTAKAAGERVNFAHYYADFCIGTVLTALLFFVGPGAHLVGGPEVDASRCLYAAAAGALFGVANLLLTTGIALAGLSIAFPLCIGTGLVLGTLLTYWVDRRGRPELLFPGVLLALLGVLANARAYALLQQGPREGDTQGPGGKGNPEDQDQEQLGGSRGRVVQHLEPHPEGDEDSGAASEGGGGDASDSSTCSEASMGGPPASSAAKNVVLCVVGGVLMGCWAPLSAKGMAGPQGLSPYVSFVCFTVASLVVGMAIIAGQQCGCAVMPRVGPVTSVAEYARVAPALHGWGLLGGFVWALGTIANLVSGGPLGFALSYALGQTAPVVAVIWGLAWYREFDGAPRASQGYIVVMFALFILAIALLCLGGR